MYYYAFGYWGDLGQNYIALSHEKKLSGVEFRASLYKAIEMSIEKKIQLGKKAGYDDISCLYLDVIKTLTSNKFKFKQIKYEQSWQGCADTSLFNYADTTEEVVSDHPTCDLKRYLKNKGYKLRDDKGRRKSDSSD